MCGIAGFLSSRREGTGDQMRATVLGMANALRHRGPDDAGEWLDPAAGVALGHRRLLVVDLSPLCHQPMETTSCPYGIGRAQLWTPVTNLFPIPSSSFKKKKTN